MAVSDLDVEWQIAVLLFAISLERGSFNTMNPIEVSKFDFKTVQEWDAKRTTELIEMYRPYIDVTDAYADLVCEIVSIIGNSKPKSVQDKVVRDLAADVFDALHESRKVILTGKCNTAYPLGRRAYESLSLMALCNLDPKIAERWQSGEEMPNSLVRRELAKHPFGETEESTRKLYKFYSSGSHTNRNFIPFRFLGEGNQFVLGAIPVPSLALVTDYCMTNLNMWFWFTAMLVYTYCDIIDPLRPDFGKRYLHVANEAQELQKELGKNYNRLLVEEQKEHTKAPIN